MKAWRPKLVSSSAPVWAAAPIATSSAICAARELAFVLPRKERWTAPVNPCTATAESTAYTATLPKRLSTPMRWSKSVGAVAFARYRTIFDAASCQKQLTHAAVSVTVRAMTLVSCDARCAHRAPRQRRCGGHDV